MVRNANQFAIYCAIAVSLSCGSLPPPHLTAVARSENTLSLHGFYNGSFLSVANRLLRDPVTTTLLPSTWLGSIPSLPNDESHRIWYIDKDLHGKDNDPLYGIESSTLAFFAGDGNDIYGWYVPNPQEVDWVPIKAVRVGDKDLRYLWLYSCRVLAHGPKGGSGRPNYSTPQSYQSSLGQNQADVFISWTPAFGPNMRMVCGGSTNLGHRGVEDIWSYLLATGTSVPDAWILGLANPKEVPACLARGDNKDPASSALKDRTLLADEAEEKQEKWLHFQYSVECDVTLDQDHETLRVGCPKSTRATLGQPAYQKLNSSISTLAPLVKSSPLQTPSVTSRELPLGFVEVEIEGSKNWKYHPKSGSVVLVKSRDFIDRYIPLKECDSPNPWTIRPKRILAQTGVNLKIIATDPAEPNNAPHLSDFSFSAYEMRVESRKDFDPRSRRCTARSLFLFLHKLSPVQFAGQQTPPPIFGPAVTFELQRQAEEEPVLASFSAPRQSLSVALAEAEPIDEDAAKQRAYDALGLNPQEYPLKNAQATFGYEQAPLHCHQTYLRPTFEIQFPPAEAVKDNRPTVTVRVDARTNPPEQSWECSGWGDFPPPAP